MRKTFLLLLAVMCSLAGCTTSIIRHNQVTKTDTIRPLPNCANVPDPHHPCEGTGPEGFVRDLVVKPFSNAHHIDMYSEEAKAGDRLWFTWFLRQGTCDFRDYFWEYRDISNDVRLLYFHEDETYRIIAKIAGQPKFTGYIKPRNFHLYHCESALDLSAGQPMQAELQLWGPGKFGDSDMTISVVPSATGKFKTGCREEKRNNLTWHICRTAIKTSAKDKDDKPVLAEQQREVWITQLGKAGYFLQLTATYSDPIFQYPIWYAERQANISEVIDTISVEPLPYPPADMKRP